MTKQSIWFDPSVKIDQLKQLNEPTLGKHLGMEWTEIGPDYLSMKMPVDDRTKQPYGLLHGGASCALAETVGSVASHLVIDAAHFICVGLEINANHLKSVRTGYVVGVAKPIHIGKKTQVWEIKITNEQLELVCVSRITMAVLDKK